VARRELVNDELWKAIVLWLPPERAGEEGRGSRTERHWMLLDWLAFGF
jgi:hypothetical protein